MPVRDNDYHDEDGARADGASRRRATDPLPALAALARLLARLVARDASSLAAEGAEGAERRDASASNLENNHDAG